MRHLAITGPWWQTQGRPLPWQWGKFLELILISLGGIPSPIIVDSRPPPPPRLSRRLSFLVCYALGLTSELGL